MAKDTQANIESTTLTAASKAESKAVAPPEEPKPEKKHHIKGPCGLIKVKASALGRYLGKGFVEVDPDNGFKEVVQPKPKPAGK